MVGTQSKRILELFSRGVQSLFKLGEKGARVGNALMYVAVAIFLAYLVVMGVHDSVLWLAENYQEIAAGLLWVFGIIVSIVILGWVSERVGERQEGGNNGN